jgi:hypothetical protein
MSSDGPTNPGAVIFGYVLLGLFVAAMALVYLFLYSGKSTTVRNSSGQDVENVTVTITSEPRRFKRLGYLAPGESASFRHAQKPSAVKITFEQGDEEHHAGGRARDPEEGHETWFFDIKPGGQVEVSH